MLQAIQIAATETTVSPAPETSITFVVVEFSIVKLFLVFRQIPLLDNVKRIAFAEISSLNSVVFLVISSLFSISILVFKPSLISFKVGIFFLLAKQIIFSIIFSVRTPLL